MGVGGVNSWGAKPGKRYMLPPHLAYRFAFVLQPFDSNEPPQTVVSRALDEVASESPSSVCPLPSGGGASHALTEQLTGHRPGWHRRAKAVGGRKRKRKGHREAHVQSKK